MMEIRRKRRRDSAVDLTPLIDVVFQLLVFFMLTSTMTPHTLPVELPEAETSEQGEDRAMVISIDRTGGLYFDTEPVTAAQLRARVRHARSERADVQAVVSADGQAVHARFVEVLDLLRKEGVTRFGIEVDPLAIVGDGDRARTVP